MGRIGLTVLMLIGYKRTDRQAKCIYRIPNCVLDLVRSSPIILLQYKLIIQNQFLKFTQIRLRCPQVDYFILGRTWTLLCWCAVARKLWSLAYSLIHTRLVSLVNCYHQFSSFGGYFWRGLGLDFHGILIDLLFIYL